MRRLNCLLLLLAGLALVASACAAPGAPGGAAPAPDAAGHQSAAATSAASESRGAASERAAPEAASASATASAPAAASAATAASAPGSAGSAGAGAGGCAIGSAFTALAAQLSSVVGTCTAAERSYPQVGQTLQPTTTGLLVASDLDQTLSFSDGTQVWVRDPTSQAVQVRGPRERFPFEFDGDGWPLVGQPAANADGACPAQPLAVLAVENFYASLVQQLGGQCVSVTTLLQDPDADPHAFSPTVDDVRAFQHVGLVVDNGLGYDDFADRIVGTLSQPPPVVRAGDVLGLQVGANPHVWYGPAAVERIRAAITAALAQANPAAATYYAARAAALDRAFGPYRQAVGEISAQFGGSPVASTESIFAEMATSTGLRLVSPAGFMDALSEGNDPAARDIAMFQDVLRQHQARVLVYNIQTVTPTTSQLQELAQQNGIPTLGVSETMPPGVQTFQGWQTAQLRLLLAALRRGTGQ